MRIVQSLVVAAALTLVCGAAQAGGDIDAGKVKSAPCAACHGADGNSPSPAFPILAGQYQDYLLRAMADYKTGKRKNPIMTGFAAALSDQKPGGSGSVLRQPEERLVHRPIHGRPGRPVTTPACPPPDPKKRFGHPLQPSMSVNGCRTNSHRPN